MFLPYFCTPQIKRSFLKGNQRKIVSMSENGNELVAQLVEQYTFNVWVLGSSPSQFTKPLNKRLFLCPYLYNLSDPVIKSR